jgi:hypothetical protein
MKKITQILTVLFLITNGVFAQTGSIKGFVKDKTTGEPIWNASVYVEIGGNLIGDAADFDGKYTIRPLSSGKYTVITKIQGYAPVKTQNVEVTSDKITYVNVDMEATAELLPTFILIEHTIPLISIDEPHVQMLSAENIKKDVNRNNPIMIATSLPGVTLAPNGKDVYIRGSRPQSTQFITDGMKSITGDIGIPGQAIGSMKVYTGGVPARYGDVTGGIIVVETKSYFDLAQDYK